MSVARMTPEVAGGIVSTEWLDANLSAPDLRVVDASWHLPTTGRSAQSEYQHCHIPGAVFFDIDEISDESSELPHMLPPSEKFVSRVRRLGLGDGNRVIVYDSVGLYSAARVWWMFRFFGHTDVAVLNGGLPKWIAEGRPIEDLPPLPQQRHFTARRNWLLVRSLDQVARASRDKSEQILDARNSARFSGQETEPRPGLRAGHIPGSRNLPIDQLLEEDGTVRSEDETRKRFKEAGIDLERPVVATCGSGVTAAVLNLALHRVGHTSNALYDGSWAEWGSASSSTRIETES